MSTATCARAGVSVKRLPSARTVTGRSSGSSTARAQLGARLAPRSGRSRRRRRPGRPCRSPRRARGRTRRRAPAPTRSEQADDGGDDDEHGYASGDPDGSGTPGAAENPCNRAGVGTVWTIGWLQDRVRLEPMNAPAWPHAAAPTPRDRLSASGCRRGSWPRAAVLVLACGGFLAYRAIAAIARRVPLDRRGRGGHARARLHAVAEPARPARPGAPPRARAAA